MATAMTCGSATRGKLRLWRWLAMAGTIAVVGLMLSACAHEPEEAAEVAMAAPAAPLPATQAAETECGVDIAQSSMVPAASSTCPAGTAFTCCPCGGCGCRPSGISPKNWCQCF